MTSDQPEWESSAAENSEEKVIDLSERFPDLRPINSTPSLYTVNGIGLGVVGARDHDQETSSYIKTHCFVFIFIPLLALRAYRVIKAPADQGWYFLGREPLSLVAKSWNAFLLLSVLGLVGWFGWTTYTESPEYQAKLKLEKAKQAADDGDLTEAAKLLVPVSQGGTSHAVAARGELGKLLADPQLLELPPTSALTVLEHAVRGRGAHADPKKTIAVAVQLAQKHAASKPVTAVKLLAAAATINQPATLKEFNNLLAGLLAQLPVEQTEQVFGLAAQTWRSPDGRRQIFEQATPRIEQFRNTNLAAAMRVLRIIAPLGPPDEVAQLRESLLGALLDEVPCNHAKEVLLAALYITPQEERTRLVQRGLEWVGSHPQADPRQAYELLSIFTQPNDADAQQIAAAQRQLLEKIVAADPNNLDATVKLGLLLEADGDPARIVELLMPFRSRLPNTNAMRLLGEALAATGDFDESYALLQPYVAERLEDFHAAEKQFFSQLEQFQKSVIATLQLGAVEDFNYNSFELKNDEEKTAMLQRYIDKRVQNNSSLVALQKQFQQQAEVVPVALNLGIVTLHRAQAMSDADARRAELEKAEKTFLAIRGAAGDSENFQLYLGQVYYWLGKPEQGRELFDQLLESRGRDYPTLMTIAPMLRELGSVREARELIEEAYEKGSNEEEKQAAAMIRAIECNDIDDKIAWLGRADADHPDVAASLESAKGDQAYEQGDRQSAAGHYRHAIAHYEPLPETSTLHNNVGLAHFKLFQATGDRESLQRGIAHIEKSIALDPDNGIVLVNASSGLLQAAIQDLAGENIDLHRLEMPWQIDAYLAMANDPEDVARHRQRIRDHAGIQKVLEFVNQTIVIAPKRILTYSLATMVYGHTRDIDGLKRVAAQLETAKLDLTEANEKKLKSYQQWEPDDIAEWRRQNEIMRRLIEEYRRDKNAPAFTLALEHLISLSYRAPQPVSKADCDQMVVWAETGQEMAPTVQGQSNLINAHLLRAHTTLAAEHPLYGKLAESAKRTLGPAHLLNIAQDQRELFQDAVATNANVIRASGLIIELNRRFPETQTPMMWALLKSSHPNEAAKIAAYLQQDEFSRVGRRISSQFGLADAENAYETYWFRLAIGDQSGADAALREAIELGVPLPDLDQLAAEQ